ncbi:hypothetical protein ACSBOB_01460 [Mesorhizobium sp. ASY16-5R]|uniref:hypothetical protein n=1 Tax=Mesorhizobium sp. ASY16-5R TaxID=3445772 RepID=UPI003FA04EB2
MTDDLHSQIAEFSTELLRAANEADKLSKDELRRILERARRTIDDLIELVEEDAAPTAQLKGDPTAMLLGASEALQRLRRRLNERKAS